MRKLALLVSALALFAFTGTSMAATVDVTVGVPYIQKNKCDQVGNMTFEWDHNTTFTVGDQIQVGLVGTPTFCKPVNMLVAVGKAGSTDASGITTAITGSDYVIATDSSEPLRQVGGTDGQFQFVSGTGIAFQVQAASGGSTLLITVVDDSNGDGTFGLEGTSSTKFIDATAPLTTELQLALFDENTYTLTAKKTALYQLNTTTGVVTNAAVASKDNTLCVNTGSTFAADYVGVGISAEDKTGQKLWDFNPASPNIAIIKPGQDYDVYNCTKKAVGTIDLCTTGTAGQGGSSATNALLIKNENGVGDGTSGTEGPKSDTAGYSDDATDAYKNVTHRNNNFVISTSNGNPFENANYSLELEIRVAPKGSTSSAQAVAGAKGFYWHSTAIKTDGFASAGSVSYLDKLTSACAAADNEATKTPALKVYDASAAEITAFAADGLTGTSACIYDPAASKAVKLVTTSTNISNYGVNVLTDGYLLVDIPDIAYDPAVAKAGDMVYVFAKLIKDPCNATKEMNIHVATVYDAAGATSTGTATNIIFPYFAEVAANGKTSAFYNGFTISNLSTSATANGTANLTIYEADGDSFTAKIENIKPGAVYANLMSLLTVTLKAKGAAGDGVFGGQRCWVSASCTFTAAGTAQITNQSAGGVHSYLAIDNPITGTGLQVHD